MPKSLSRSRYHGDNPTNVRKSNDLKDLTNNDGMLILCIGTGPSPFRPRSTPTFHVIFMTIFFVIIFPASLTTALPTRLARSYTGDNLSAGLVLKKYSTPMTVKVAFLHPKTHNLSTETFNASAYVTSPTIVPPTPPRNVTVPPPPPPPQGVPEDDSQIDTNNNDDDRDLSSAPVPIFVITSNTSESTTILPETTPGKHVNLAVIPVLGIFFLMILVCFKGCSWFREHLKEHDTEDDGKDYVILSPPEDGYREVEFRSDTSSMYYDTVSSYRSILRQKGEYGIYNNYDTVTSIRSYLQRADVRDAAVQVRLQGQRPDRWKSVSGILNIGGGSNSDLLRVPKKTHRQVSFQTSHNETYDPPSPRMCDANIQVGESTMERSKQEKTPRFQNGILPRQISASYGSRSCLTSAIPNRHSSSSLRSMDKSDSQPLKRTDSTGCTSANNNSMTANVGSGATGRPKNRRFHNFQVLRVNSSDRLSSREIDRIDTSPLRQAMMTSHYMEQNRSSSGLSLNKAGLAIDHQDRLDRGELYGAPMTTMCHPHYLCDQFVQTDTDSANDSMSPATAAAHTSFTPPILTEVKLDHALSDDEDSDELDRRKKSDTGGLLHELYIGESSDTTTGEESMLTSGRNSASWSEQMDEEDQLQKLLAAHASAIAGAPIASPISMDSTSSSSTDDVAQIVELDRGHQIGTEAADATTASDESGEGRSGIARRLGVPGRGQVVDDDEPRDEETPLIERSPTDLGISPYSRSPDIGSGALTSTRPHRVSSGYDTQGPESSSVKGPAEAGDSSCDVTPLTSSSNSLQECGREAGKGGIHSQLPLQLLIFQNMQQDDRSQAQRAPDFESRHQAPSSHTLNDNTVTGKDDTLKAQNLDQPLSYIPQLHPHDTANNNNNTNTNNNNSNIPAFNSNNDNTFPRYSLGSTDSNFSNRSSNVSMDVHLTSAGSIPPTPTDRLDVNPTTARSSRTTPKNDNTQATSVDAELGLCSSDGSDDLKTPTSTLKDSFSVPVVQADEPLRMRAKTETLPPVVIPLNTLPPPPPSARGMSSYQSRKRANTSTDSNVKR